MITRLGSHVKVMTALSGPTDVVERAQALRGAGASGVFTFEGPHDAFTPLVLAATVGGLDLMTNVAIAFPRNRWLRSSARCAADVLSWYRDGPPGGSR
jgi:hypothetical protein